MLFNYLLRETQFHGGRRLAERHFRLWWSIGFVLLLCSSAAVIQVTLSRYLRNPTFMVREETFERNLEFPSVLVCPEILFLESKVEEFLKNINIPPGLNHTYLKHNMHQLAAYYSPDVVFQPLHLLNIEQLLEYNGMDVFSAGMLLTATCEETLIRCRWRGNFVNCSDLFNMELTGDGYCCVFNGRSLRSEANSHSPPKKYISKYAGFGSGLMLVVNQTQTPVDVDLTYKWLALQSGQHFVESSINGTALNPGSEQWAAFNIRSLKISKEARTLSGHLRRCRLGSEALQYFPLYHRRYCVVECEMARALARCNCVRIIHPLPKGARYCHAAELLCAKSAKVPYDSDACDCPQACDIATTFMKTSTFHLEPRVRSLDSFYHGLDYENVTIIRVFLQSRKVNTRSRRSYYTNTDFFAQLGGVFNLFFGCSILTLLELGFLIIYGLKYLMSRKHTANASAVQKETENIIIKRKNKVVKY